MLKHPPPLSGPNFKYIVFHAGREGVGVMEEERRYPPSSYNYVHINIVGCVSSTVYPRYPGWLLFKKLT